MSRGATHWISGPDDDARELGLNPVSSGVRTEDEGLYLIQHSYWQETMRKAVEAEAAEEVKARSGPNGYSLSH
jgi:benzoate/toluate 1,2-dioxygenase alpha subunit